MKSQERRDFTIFYLYYTESRPWWIPWHGLVGGGLLTTDDYLSNKVYSLSDSLQIERLLLRRETERVPRNGTQMNLSSMEGTIG